ncbi:MAG TPA: hypothetical protein ENK57_02770 [Polyangiaceae bacterium]|nr:hypothetical protein [Polyangiaceae bacterium]
MSRPPIRPDRVRTVRTAFAAIPNRFLHDGFFASLGHVERSLYLFLVIAGDRRGVSYYGHERICSTLEIDLDTYLAARNALVELDLIATDGVRFQVLSLPARPHTRSRAALSTRDDFERADPATVRNLLREALDER